MNLKAIDDIPVQHLSVQYTKLSGAEHLPSANPHNNCLRLGCQKTAYASPFWAQVIP